MKIVNTQVPVRHLIVILRHRTPKVSSAGLGVDQPKYFLIPIYFAVLFGPLETTAEIFLLFFGENP